MQARAGDRRRHLALRGAAIFAAVAAIAVAVVVMVVDPPRHDGEPMADRSAPALPASGAVAANSSRESALTRAPEAAAPLPPEVAAPSPRDGASSPSERAPAASSPAAPASQLPPTPPAEVVASAAEAPTLRALIVPVEGVAAASLRDTFAEGRPGHPHEAIDIAAPRGARVLAVDDGKLVKLFTSVPGGLTIYQFDPESRFAYYYAHLDRYAEGLREGMQLQRGDVIGYVGTSGNAPADAPHLHFAVFRLGPERQWWKGEAINPFGALH